MSKNKNPWALEEIEPYALEIFHKLKPYCDQIKIAGSIRRRKSYINDVELVCVPKTHIETVESTDLFGAAVSSVTKREYMFVSQLNRFGCVQKGDPETGKYISIQYQHAQNLHNQGLFQIDLFCTTQIDFGRILAIRTGPFDYSRKVLATGWAKRGYVGTEDGIRLRRECVQIGNKWICKLEKPTLPPAFLTEQDFFNFIRENYVKPEYRK